MTSFGPKSVMLPTQGPNWPFRCLDFWLFWGIFGYSLLSCDPSVCPVHLPLRDSNSRVGPRQTEKALVIWGLLDLVHRYRLVCAISPLLGARHRLPLLHLIVGSPRLWGFQCLQPPISFLAHKGKGFKTSFLHCTNISSLNISHRCLNSHPWLQI